MSALGGTDRVESLSQRRELSEAAKALLADKAFSYVYKALRQRWFNQFMDLGGAGREQDELAARLRALDAIPVELGLLLNEYRNDVRMGRSNAS